MVVEKVLPSTSPQHTVEENPQPSTTRTPEYDITYIFNDITIQTKIFFFLYQGRPSKAKTVKRGSRNKTKNHFYQAGVLVRARLPEQAEHINLPLSPFNGIKDFDDSWPIFIDEEEEGSST